MQNGAAMMENSVVVSQEVKHKIATGTGNLTSQVALVVKKPPEDPLEEGMATHSSILAWRIPQTEEPGGLHTVHGAAKSWTQLKQPSTHPARVCPKQ